MVRKTAKDCIRLYFCLPRTEIWSDRGRRLALTGQLKKKKKNHLVFIQSSAVRYQWAWANDGFRFLFFFTSSSISFYRVLIFVTISFLTAQTNLVILLWPLLSASLPSQQAPHRTVTHSMLFVFFSSFSVNSRVCRVWKIPGVHQLTLLS